jgi:hypothetical protein
MSGSGFRGPECLACGGIRSEVKESGYTVDDQRIRRRQCLDCGGEGVSVEVYIDGDTTFWRLNPDRAYRKRENDYRRRGKGIYRLPNRQTVPDRLGVVVTVTTGGKVPTTQCRRGHALTPDNVYITPGSGYRDCVTCRRVRAEARRIA